MVAQTKSENANLKRIAKIIYILKLKGLSQQKIADELNVTRQVVNKVIHGSAKSKRVENWLKENLGV